MQIINYNYGNISRFECVIRGKIVMSPHEWRIVRAHLMARTTLATLAHGLSTTPTGANRQISDRITRCILRKGVVHFSLGTTATDEIVRQFRPKGAVYRRQNYMIEVSVPAYPALDPLTNS